MLCWCMGCLCLVLPATSSVQPLVPSVAHTSCSLSGVPVGAEQKEDACGQCSLLSSIARCTAPNLRGVPVLMPLITTDQIV